MTPLNPYSPISPDDNLGLVRRPEIDHKLAECLLGSRPPANVAIVAERGMGAPAAVRRYLTLHAATLPFRIVHFDVKNMVSRGQTPLDFYRTLALAVHDTVRVPAAADTVALIQRDDLSDAVAFGQRFFSFFRHVREADPDRPLLLVFYYFDRLPERIQFASDGWAWLRELHDLPAHRVHYVIVSRRGLGYVERLHGLESSLFATRIPASRRVGLLDAAQADEILDAAKGVGQPWPGWLRSALATWGGRHPYCLQRLCWEMFNRLNVHHHSLTAAHSDGLAGEWLNSDHLGDYFDRLYKRLAQDQLLEPLTRARVHGYYSPDHAELTELVDMGYLVPQEGGSLATRRYDLFSPLFGRYLAARRPPPGPGEMPPDWPPPTLVVTERLAPREARVLWLMTAHGMTKDDQLATALNVSVNTIRDYKKAIRTKLDVQSRDDAIAKARPFVPRD